MFTYENYERILKQLVEKGYSFKHFKEDYNCQGTVFLRHDIDVDLAGALKLSEIENALCVKSIFYFQPNNPFYNPLNEDSVTVFKKIIDNGSCIGLHVDASLFRSKKQIEAYLIQTHAFFSSLFPLEKSFSFHRPSKDLLNNIIINDFINAYEDRFFKEIRYFSDSNQRDFYDKAFLSALNSFDNMQLLIHPIWWKELDFSFLDIKNFFLEKEQLRTIKALSETSKKFHNYFKGTGYFYD